MKKQVYQSPSAYVYKVIGKAVLSTSIIVDGSGKVDDESNIGFTKEQDSQSGSNKVWDEEW
ncbi:MAG: hypothetical protein J6V92_07010 [Bacteroidaceae bacterium]|nr:hypothetical protein [Bacteroidaceae bacterium]